jgi:Family of unknown function (DUF6636)
VARVLTLAGLAVALALAATGCGGGGTTTVINRTVTKTTEAGGGEASGSSAGGGAQAARVLHLATFRSPSGNIGCVLLGGRARCDIRRRDWSPPPRPPGCPPEVDFGQGLQVGRGDRSGSFVCAGDTALNPSAAGLAYGSDDRFGGFTCASRRAGVRCANSARHGFFVSIERYRTF